MTTRIVEGLELFSEAQLESLEFLPEELENIEFELYPNLESISLEEVAEDLEVYFEGRLTPAALLTKLKQTKLGVGRKKAVDVTKKYPPNTVGAVVHTAVRPFAKTLGDFASATIGLHYAKSHPWLKLPATNFNLSKFAQRETDWWIRLWKRERNLAGLIGSSVTPDFRAKFLIQTRDKGKKSLIKARDKGKKS